MSFEDARHREYAEYLAFLTAQPVAMRRAMQEVAAHWREESAKQKAANAASYAASPPTPSRARMRQMLNSDAGQSTKHAQAADELLGLMCEGRKPAHAAWAATQIYYGTQVMHAAISKVWPADVWGD